LANDATIDSNIYTSLNTKVCGNVNISNNCAIIANAIVEKSFFNERMIIGGVPAKEIGTVDIKTLIKHIK
jgi:serine O-acetyltransferase